VVRHYLWALCFAARNKIAAQNMRPKAVGQLRLKRAIRATPAATVNPHQRIPLLLSESWLVG
jgi:hypothetical protein